MFAFYVTLTFLFTPLTCFLLFFVLFVCLVCVTLMNVCLLRHPDDSFYVTRTWVLFSSSFLVCVTLMNVCLLRHPGVFLFCFFLLHSDTVFVCVTLMYAIYVTPMFPSTSQTCFCVLRCPYVCLLRQSDVSFYVTLTRLFCCCFLSELPSCMLAFYVTPFLLTSL